MHVLDIRTLKATLKARALSSGEVVRYLAAQWALLSWLFIPGQTTVDWMFITNPLFALAGAYYCYLCNGGADGIRLAERYLAVGWVVMCRGIAFLLLPLAIGLAAWTIATAGEGPDDAVMSATLIGLMLLMYWRIGVHLADVAGPVAGLETPVVASR
jgi:hypothetical protein